MTLEGTARGGKEFCKPGDLKKEKVLRGVTKYIVYVYEALKFQKLKKPTTHQLYALGFSVS